MTLLVPCSIVYLFIVAYLSPYLTGKSVFVHIGTGDCCIGEGNNDLRKIFVRGFSHFSL